MFTHEDSPFVLLLTHRRGGAVLAVDPKQIPAHDVPLTPTGVWQEFSEAFFQKQSDLLSWQKAVLSACVAWKSQGSLDAKVPFSTFHTKGLALAISVTTTAEQLAQMYTAAIASLSLVERDISHLVLGIGPGSFTGLRIGCAFANGLARGRPRALWSVPCPSLISFSQLCTELGYSALWEEDFTVLAQGQDESCAHVGFFDVMMCVSSLATESCRRESVLIPAYGKEPGPVLKLRAGELGRS